MCLKTIHLFLESIALILQSSHTPLWPYLMSQVFIFNLVDELWVWGVDWVVVSWSLLSAFYSSLPARTLRCAAASCWVSIANCLFFVLAWYVSQHRMWAAFYTVCANSDITPDFLTDPALRSTYLKLLDIDHRWQNSCGYHHNHLKSMLCSWNLVCDVTVKEKVNKIMPYTN